MPTRTGYAVKIIGFVPIDMNDLAKHRAALDAIEKATGKPASADALFQLMKVEEMSVKPVQRRGEAP